MYWIWKLKKSWKWFHKYAVDNVLNITLQSWRLLTHSTCCFSQNGSGLSAQTAARWLANVICTCSVEALNRRQQPCRESINTTTLWFDEDALNSQHSNELESLISFGKLVGSSSDHFLLLLGRRDDFKTSFLINNQTSGNLISWLDQLGRERICLNMEANKTDILQRDRQQITENSIEVLAAFLLTAGHQPWIARIEWIVQLAKSAMIRRRWGRMRGWRSAQTSRRWIDRDDNQWLAGSISTARQISHASFQFRFNVTCRGGHLVNDPLLFFFLSRMMSTGHLWRRKSQWWLFFFSKVNGWKEEEEEEMDNLFMALP